MHNSTCSGDVCKTTGFYAPHGLLVVWQEELAEVTKQQARVDKELSAAEQENKRLRESLQEAEQKQPELQKQLEDYNQAKAKMAVRSLQSSESITTNISNYKLSVFQCCILSRSNHLECSFIF